MNTRLLLVDDHTLFRESVARLLMAEEDFEVVAHCGSVGDALEVLRHRAVDVVLLDWDLGAETGSDFIQEAQKAGFEGRVLLVTAGINENEVAALVQKGIAGVFMKHRSPALLIRGIRDVIEGKVWFEHDFLKKVLEEGKSRPEEARRSRFTERERQVLKLVFGGAANKQIADQLRISESSVKGTLQQLFAKTGVRTRSQLVRIVLEEYQDQL